VTQHRIARADLEVALTQIVRTGERIDSLHLDGDEWVVITEDRIETRLTHADRLGVTR
jgi:hypothetical protein